MAIKLFTLGLPGSGKSTIARYISSNVEKKRIPGTEEYWVTKYFNDYKILDKMSQESDTHHLFKPADPAGFDVIDPIAFDIALQKLEEKIANHLSSPNTKLEELIIIEFSRNSYRHALDLFNEIALQDAYFIHLDAKVEVCKQRIRDRVASDIANEDDYHVSEYIFETYYHSDDGKYLAEILEQSFKIDRQRVLAIGNNHALELAIEKIVPFFDSIFDSVPSDKSNVRPGCH